MPKELIDDCLAIDFAVPAIRQTFRRGQRRWGRLTWSYAGADVATAGYDWDGCAPCLTLRYCIAGVAHAQRVRVTETIPHFGGRRAWFVCPISGKRVRTLLLAPGETRWAGRSAASVSYRSQRTRHPGLRALLVERRRALALERRNAVRRLRHSERRACG